MQPETYPFVNQPLPYNYDALEPYIDTKTMMLHHDRHLQTYIDNLNATLRPYPYLHQLTLEQLIMHTTSLPHEIQTAVRNNAGGVYNHRFYFSSLQPAAEQQPQGMLAEAINKSFGNLDSFLAAWKAAALSVFGSGYVWLVCINGDLRIITTPNQNSPLEAGLQPILNLDVWEHAYYLKHFNVRADYIADWTALINWSAVESRYASCAARTASNQ